MQPISLELLNVRVLFTSTPTSLKILVSVPYNPKKSRHSPPVLKKFTIFEKKVDTYPPVLKYAISGASPVMVTSYIA